MLCKIAKKLREEIKMAREYCHEAVLVRSKSAETADLFIMLAGEELEHAKKLLKEAERIVHGESFKDEEHEEMLKIYEWEHDFAVEEIAEINSKISFYKNMR